MKQAVFQSVTVVVLALLVVPAAALGQGTVNPPRAGDSTPGSGPDPWPGGGDPAPGLYGLDSAFPANVYTIDAGSGAATLLVTTNGSSSLVGLSFLGGEAYGSDLISFPGGSGGFDVGLIDLVGGIITFVSDQDGSSNWHGLATNDSAGVLYTIDINDDNILKTLAPDGTVTSIGTGTGIDGRGMAYDDANGILYATNNVDNSLYTVSTADGTSTLVGATGLPNLDRVGLAYDEDNDILYLNDDGTASLYTVNVSTGAASLVGSNGVDGIDGLAWIGEGGGCILTAQIPTRARAGEALPVDLAIQHNRGRTVSVPFRMEISDRRGNVVATEVTVPFTLELGQRVETRQQIALPEWLAPGVYRLVVSMDEMRGGTEIASRKFRIER